MTTHQDSRPSCIGSLSLAGLLVFTAVVSLLVQFQCQRTADADDWQRAAEYAVALSEPTDAIRVHPIWTETPLVHLQPVGNLLHRHHEPLLEDLLGIERVLILSESRHRDEALRRLPFDSAPEATHSFGSVELLEVTVPEALRIDRDLTHYLADARVALHSEDAVPTECRRSLRGGVEWRCGGRDTIVRSVLKEMEDDPRRCIQAYPPSADRFLSLQFRVEQTADILRLRAGLDNRAARLESGDDVLYRIYVDDEPIADERIDAHTSQWTAHDVSTADLQGGPVDVRIEVESVVSNPHHRRFCFNGWPLTTKQANSQNSNR